MSSCLATALSSIVSLPLSQMRTRLHRDGVASRHDIMPYGTAPAIFHSFGAARDVSPVFRWQRYRHSWDRKAGSIAQEAR